MTHRTIFIFIAILLVLLPYAGLPGGIEDGVMQLLALVLLAVAVIVPRKRAITTVERTDLGPENH